MSYSRQQSLPSSLSLGYALFSKKLNDTVSDLYEIFLSHIRTPLRGMFGAVIKTR